MNKIQKWQEAMINWSDTPKKTVLIEKPFKKFLTKK
jgi:hypothetical protein